MSETIDLTLESGQTLTLEISTVSPPGPQGPEGPPGEAGVSPEVFLAHVESETPHPVYDDGPSFFLLYQNAKV